MYDFDSLMDEVLRNRPELTREEVMSMIEEKKQTVGAGFLTDQGALFLIAGELGVKLQHMTTTDLTLKDLYVGANDITIVARVLAIYPVAEYKKKDEGVGRYRRLVLFDGNGTSKLTIWDDNPEAINLAGISVDTPVRVLNGYVRQGLDGKPNLNLGRKGKIEILKDEKLVSKMVPLSGLSKGLGQIAESQDFVAVEGLVLTGSRSSTFTRQDGSNGSLTQFELGGPSTERMRVVIWNAVDVEVKTGQRVVVTNLRLKKNMNGDRELHGDNGSVVKVSVSPT
jgi:ssDNA-binding replication factor A large subunit